VLVTRTWADRFATIGSIVPEEASTWTGRLFLTIDVDWACDEVLLETIDLLERATVAATFFVTHDTPLLRRVSANPRFELAIHPNFNALLSGESAREGGAERVVEELLAVVPRARSVRSHSMTQSSRLLDLFHRRGLTHDCNHFVPAGAGIELKPFRHWNGLIRVPYFWEDDVALAYGDTLDTGRVRAAPGLKVFDFHPIHVALNSPNLQCYEDSRPVHNDRARLREFSCSGEGVRTALERLLWNE
jgi:hypothetical protein